ncbi:hypothetical protein F543_20370 [Bibersteinia trehalosi USDA-ARS-USMARC-189]|uniref:Transferrin-binding protein B C-lobe/N-lobe beta barrel domain-containing protein n=1 Tax=Bibersteinia trehalosi USDA-ARS-USMARC-189 TaxID=1263831 RepID=A0ABM5PEZ5_BIBTR|nr:hypothetical protein [Bibersteinia trehalosi]AGH37630.1 hypothetical protein WQG_3470 [Bibersteinia trehalosi USDA-ARS-USMARC-192]AHG84895.1 hypothetical protein F543_20370 [Bibersteinia trehalosi USDA-ARS-USMARC-189]
MTLKKHSLAICVSLALLGSLTACSGSSNKSSPVTNQTEQGVDKAKQEQAEKDKAAEKARLEKERQEKEKAEKERQEKEKAEKEQKAKEQAEKQYAEKQKREQLETQLDPQGKTKWRQIANFIPSSDTSANNPLQASQNGKISPQLGAAAYTNGDSRYVDGNTVKDFRDQATRASTSYTPSFMSSADIDPSKIQMLEILNSSGQPIANIHFVNQQYSSYNTWKSAKTPTVGGDPIDSIMSGYVALPTKPDIDLKSKGQATYRGHTLAQTAPNSNDIHLGNIELNADFDAMKISGKLTNRNDRLLDSSVKRFFPEEFREIYTTDKDEWEDDKENLKLISKEEYAKLEAQWEKDLEAKMQQFRKIDVSINQTDIKTDNSVISFTNPLGALSYTDNGKTRNTGVVGGIFAGDKAQEVVGEIQGSSNFMSFGATEVTK